jgi:putative membrane protein
MASLLSNPYIATTAYYAVTGLAMILFLTIFELVTRYNVMEEIKNGNLAVAMATGGKIFGVANVFRFSIEHHDSIGRALIWGSFGFVLLLISYYIFEFMTPSFQVDEEIARDNRAVGLIAMVISVGFSYVIGASLSL